MSERHWPESILDAERLYVREALSWGHITRRWVRRQRGTDVRDTL